MLEPKYKSVCVRINFLNKEKNLTNSGPGIALLASPIVIFLCGPNHMACSWVPVLKTIGSSLIPTCMIEDAKFSCSYPNVSQIPFHSQYVALDTKAQTLVQAVLVENWAQTVFDAGL